MRLPTPMTLVPKVFLSVAMVGICGCASTFDVDGALAVAPYSIAENGLIVVEARVNDQGPFNFALDTGASISFLFDELTNELAIEPVPETSIIVHGAVASGQFPLLNISRLQVEGETWLEPRIVSLPDRTLARTDIDGVLGINFMKRYALGFSARDQVLRLYPPELVRDRAYRGWASVPLRPANIRDSGETLYFFEININERNVRALFDLGATTNMINWPAADQIGIVRMNMDPDALIAGAIDSAQVVAEFTARGVRAGGIRWRNQQFLIADLSIFSVLDHEDSPLAIVGTGLFNRRDFVIDFVRNRLLVEY